MRSDDDQFASRQVASSTLFRNTSLLTPVPYRTVVYDVRPFASVSFQFSPSTLSVYPLYLTIEWWHDQAMTQLVRRDAVNWVNAGPALNRTWQGIIPCRSDWLTVTLDSPGAADCGMVIIGQSRPVAGIQQQLPQGAGGLPPFALIHIQEAIVGPANGPPYYFGPWFGEVEIISYTTGLAAAGSYLAINQLAGLATFGDAFQMPYNNTAGGFGIAGLQWAGKQRMACVGNQISFRHINLEAANRTFVTTVQPIGPAYP